MLLLILLGALLFYPIGRAIYNLTLHPLSKYPGPRLWSAFTFPYVFYVCRGSLPKKIKELHDQYGPVVRITPTDLSFVSAQAWRDIYGARNPQNPKDANTYIPPDEYSGKRMVTEENDAKHKAARDQISHAFSTKALLEHQPLITDYVDQLVSSIRKHIPENKPLDVTAWFNWTTFDIIGHLTFGESFHCLDTESYHPWIKVIFEGVAISAKINQLRRYGLLNLFMKFIPKSMEKPRNDMVAYSMKRMDERLKLGFGEGTRKDFAYFMRNGPEHTHHGAAKSKPVSDMKIEVMSRDVMCANGETIVIAGSETTATLLSGLTFLLLTKRPDYLARLQDEVRTVFPDDTIDSINFKSVTEKVPLLVAAIHEALRFYPPAPFGFARRIVNQPRNVDGHLIPPNSSCSISQYAANHAAENWHLPSEFLPERWLDDALEPDSPYFHDQREACQPFSFGPRGCLGKTLAEVESRIIYAKMLYNFDFDIVEGQDQWLEKQDLSLICGKGPLMIKFTDVRAE